MSVVDHIIIAVSDLEQASQDSALKMSRSPGCPGPHDGSGRAQVPFQLENGSLALRAAA